MPFINELYKYIHNNYVETSALEGENIYKLINSCKSTNVIGLETSNSFFNTCITKFIYNTNVVFYELDSKYELYNIIKNINKSKPITFWLNKPVTETNCNILEELEQIQTHNNTHTIMIDNISLINKYYLLKIKKMIHTINPNYIIQYYHDSVSKNNILVAYLEKKICIHKYLQICKTNPNPPGLADYLRGTIALYYFSKKYGYKLLIDNDHPLFKFIKPNKNIISSDSKDIIEVICPISYSEIFIKLNNMFSNGESFTVLTNSFYNNHNGCLYNWGDITNDCKEYLKQIYSPTIEVENNIEHIFNTVYKINKDEEFKIIHLRFGDVFIHDNIFDENIYNEYYNKINDLVNKSQNKNNYKYVLLSDSSIIANKLKENINGLCYWNNLKVHIGDLIHNTDASMLDTLTDFFIISKSKEIISNCTSGFSIVISKMYDIKYSQF
jgi:hypothetical protein